MLFSSRGFFDPPSLQEKVEASALLSGEFVLTFADRVPSSGSDFQHLPSPGDRFSARVDSPLRAPRTSVNDIFHESARLLPEEDTVFSYWKRHR